MNKINRIVGFMLTYFGLYFLSPSAQASQLFLPKLPSTCQYTQQEITPLAGLYNIAVSTPVNAGLKEGNGENVLSVGVSCTSLESPLSLAFNLTGPVKWTGGGNNILVTSLNGVGVSLLFEPRYTGEITTGCQIADVVKGGSIGSGSRGVGCVLPSSNKPLGVILTLRARLMKTGNNTPMAYSGVVSLPGSELAVNVNGQQTSVGPWMTPSVYTEPSCTLITAKDQFIDFGNIKLPSNRSKEQSIDVEPRSIDIGVSCQPLWDGNQNTYDVSITFDGKTRNGSENILETSRRDLGITLSPVLQNGRINTGNGVIFKKSLPMFYEISRSDDSASLFARRFLVGLNYYPDGGSTGGGEFQSIITYTITINH